MKYGDISEKYKTVKWLKIRYQTSLSYIHEAIYKITTSISSNFYSNMQLWHIRNYKQSYGYD